ncbi:MAG: hypothetical protein WA825_09465 [Steroidobacteraceae bacterium]
MWRAVLMVGCLGVQWGTSLASAPTDCMDSCAVLKSEAARLACFDQELERRKTASPNRVCTLPVPAAAPAPSAAAAPAPAPAPAPALATATPPAPAAVPATSAAQRSARPQPISARVVAIAKESAGIVTITLDNGQVWEQTETRAGFRVLLHHGVTIAPGVFGSYLLTTEDHRTARVRRIR